MKSSAALLAVSEITSGQWGMVTTSQAESRGVGRLDMSRLTKMGYLERIRQGVYRNSGVPESRYDALRAEWLSFMPGVLAEKRQMHPERDAVVSGTTAAWLRGEGDFSPKPYMFQKNERVQKVSQAVRVKKADISESDVEYVQGLPATTPTRTTLDLMLQGEDLGAISQMISDSSESEIDFTPIYKNVNRIASAYSVSTKEMESRLDMMNQMSKAISPTLKSFSASNDQIQKIASSISSINSGIINQISPDFNSSLGTLMKNSSEAAAISAAAMAINSEGINKVLAEISSSAKAFSIANEALAKIAASHVSIRSEWLDEISKSVLPSLQVAKAVSDIATSFYSSPATKALKALNRSSASIQRATNIASSPVLKALDKMDQQNMAIQRATNIGSSPVLKALDGFTRQGEELQRLENFTEDENYPND